ncbi:hypothetical protein [Streptomyces sp. NPDC004721]
MTREELLAQARKHLWAAWTLSSEEIGSQAAATLLGLGMLVPEGGAQELEQLRAQLTVSEQRSERRRIAWRLARTRAVATGSAADRYAARAREGQEALQNMLFAIIGSQLARRAAERQAEELRARVAELEAAQGTVFRAAHDSIVMGLYTTAAEARKHCETELRREYAESTKVSLWWREDEDTVDQPEDGEGELFAHVTPRGFDCGRTWRTGYVVTPLEVASAYDPDGDE